MARRDHASPGSFINLDKSSNFNVSRNGILGLTRALKVPEWGLEGLAPKFPYVKVGFPSAANYEVDGLIWNEFHL